MNLSKEIQKELNRIGSNIQLAKTIDDDLLSTEESLHKVGCRRNFILTYPQENPSVLVRFKGVKF
jgi:hypothetical protein